MSFKGFKKAVARFPHQIFSKPSAETKDPEFDQLEARFNQLAKHIERLSKDSRDFRDNISGMLMHQTTMASCVGSIYDARLGAETAGDVVEKRVRQTPSEIARAVHDTEVAMSYCQTEVLSKLDDIDRHIIRPLLELGEVVKLIQKTLVKRKHKQVDYDRFNATLKKLDAKTNRSLSEEKEFHKVNRQFEVASSDYEYLNSLLKQQLPQFLQLKSYFITPLLEHFFCLQRDVFWMIYARSKELIHANPGHFKTLDQGIEQGYESRMAETNCRAELEELDLLNSNGKAWIIGSGSTHHENIPLRDRMAFQEAQQQQQQKFGSPPSSYNHTTSSPPPSYSQYQTPPNPFAPPVKPPILNNGSKTGQTFVEALYDYDAQADGDLSFKQGDRFELIERKDDANDWWTGKLRGTVGVFPGNYVQIL